MRYVLYGAHGSGSSIIEAALAELGVAYDFEPLDFANQAQRSQAYASVNPHCKVPTLLTPQGETLTESVAIMLTLAERHPEGALLPPVGSPDRARALRWLLFAAGELYPVVELMDYPERFAPNEGSRGEVRERAHEVWRHRWSLVEEGLGDGPYLLGEDFCAADLQLAVLSRWDLPADWAEEALPKVCRLAGAVAERPRLQEIWPRNFPLR